MLPVLLVYLASLPSRERGLKSCYELHYMLLRVVAPFAGAWIEILPLPALYPLLLCRSLRGSVD